MKNLSEKAAENSSRRVSVTGWITSRLNRWQTVAAGFLNRKTAAWTTARLRTMLAVFCLMAATACGFVLVDAIRGKVKTIAVRHDVIPVFLLRDGQHVSPPANCITEQELKKVERCKAYLDSLGATPTGKGIRDSLLRDHPGLIDSMQQVINIYNNQKERR